ncbi:type IV-A pilus assembly ATPase PilB [Pseudenhygromyxa sp. WMMC2535]|uniref:type IV-A pilus assembly ATPase PilB n=1 Tax=Pseudenhygromyxa sp. WMMC2535 TaxID=2712867 RepID=UPI001555E42C|nr:type IV-A pilus assembly ATPase PilB [Pseudenhygromyxa sp. WMMC2535]NVB36850.1 type IV-A pilus assembly ATPase PilB [Pseudenhygromyxa sp. WMMC2535]
MASERIGELLVRENLISTEQLREAQKDQRSTGKRLAYSLTRLGILQESELTDFLSKQYGVPSITLDDFEIDPEVIELVPREVASKHVLIPVQRANNSLIVAMADPSNIYAIDDVKFMTSLHIEPVVSTDAAIEAAIERYYAPAKEVASYQEVLGDIELDDIEFEDNDDDDFSALDSQNEAEQAPVVKLCNLILVNAISKGASDIHIEPYEKSYRVRYRIDGVLHHEMNPPLKLKNAITSRFKIMSNLDIAERRLPQDGRIKIKLSKGREMDFRVSCLPTLYGEKIVLRLLDKENLQLDMTKLGFETEPLGDFKEAIHRPYGMCLVTGPTGSGKTTTLYSALSELNDDEVNISTAEDPVEFNLGGINQVQMHEDIGLNFAAALRSFLRQDPDIIMVGEIRDFETAEIGVKAALTGHMVLSTLHTNDAPSTVNRLLNMGVEPFLVTAAVNLIVAQRLARRICKDCKVPDTSITPEALIEAGMKPAEAKKCTPMKGKGCKTCSDSGYKGRVALYEVMVLKDPLKDLILQGASTGELKAEAIRLGMNTLRRSGLNKIHDGMTTLEEVLRVTAAD